MVTKRGFDHEGEIDCCGRKKIGNFLPLDPLKSHCVGLYRSVLGGRKEIGNFLPLDPLKSLCRSV